MGTPSNWIKEMKQSNTYLILVGIIACWIFFISEIIIDIWFGNIFPNYNWLEQSISYLGQAGSPILHWVKIWGVAFTVLLFLFSTAFYQVFQKERWVKIATMLLVIYAFGEGVGSGFFPINPEGTPLTLDGRLHNIFGGIGDAGIVLLPFVFMQIFSKKDYPKFRKYLWSVVGIGMLMASFFLIAKYFHPDTFILHYKGVWQRIYLFNYHLMLVVVSLEMIKAKNQAGFFSKS